MFLILSAFFVAVIGICCIFLNKKQNELAKHLLYVNLIGIASTVFYAISILRIPIFFAYLTANLYYASIHWLLISFVNFILELVEINRRKKLILNFARFWGILIIYDTVSLIVNTFTHHIFSLSPFFIDKSFFLWMPRYYSPFSLHLFFCYILVFLIIAVLIYKIAVTNKFYRRKYISVLSLFIFVIVLNVSFLLTKMIFDCSILFYCLLSVTATYFTIFSLPRRIEATMLQLVSDNLNSGIFCFDKDKNCLYSNKMAKQFFPSRTQILNELNSLLLQHRELVIRNIEVNRNNTVQTLSEEFNYLKDTNEKLLGYSLRLTDITEELKKVKIDQYKATHDALTDLLNRETFYLEAEKIIRNDPDTPRYLISTNIKNFKLVNDLFGSHFGDELLKMQSQIMLSEEYKDSLLGRISGDKFAILMKKTDFSPSIIEHTIDKLQQLTSELNYKLHIFFGIYEISDPYEKISSMYDKASLSIKNIQENYSISFAYYDTALLSTLIKNKNIVAEFDNSLADEQFKMYLQPQISAKDDKVVGAEALVRWEHPGKGILYPTSFIHVLEDTGYLYKLDKYIWEKAAATLSKWKRIGFNMYIAVNISAKDFYHLDLYKIFTGLVEKYDIEPSSLKLEVTETVLMHDLNMHKKILSKLQDFGFSIEMDDFGSGYSSLNMLKNIDIDILKIDMTFLQKTSNEERSKKIIQSIIKMAKNLHMTIVVEGIEDINQAEYLKSLGCDLFQGFLYSKPVAQRDFEKKWITKAVL